MAENTQVSTDARVPNIQRAVNLINTGGSSTNNQVMRVVINGKSHFVQTRYMQMVGMLLLQFKEV